MRAVVFAAVLLGSSSLCPVFAQTQQNSPSNQSPSVPVQPERTPQQSDQSRDQDQKRADDVRVRPGWRAEERDSDRMDRAGSNDMGRMRDQAGHDRDWDRRTVGRNWRMDDDRSDRDDYRRGYADRDRGYYDRDQPRRRVKVCIEYEDGDEYCRYRD
jgi:hypothetical protein